MKKNFYLILTLIIIFTATFLAPRFFVLAFGDDLSLSVFPENPEAGEEIKITASGFTFNVDDSDFIWAINGKVALKGRGEKSLTFTNGEAGKVTEVVVTVIGENGESVVRKISFAPQDLDILWEAETYTPPFYRGKALPSSEAYITFFALPHFFVSGKKLAPTELTYTWKINNKILSDFSGLGKTSIRIKGPELFSKMEVEVAVSNRTGSTSQNKKLTIEPIFPELIFYREDALEGTNYAKVLENPAKFGEGEVGVRVEPYFFSLSEINFLDYAWRVNGFLSKQYEKSRVVVFRNREGQEKGRVSVSLEVQNQKNVGQISKASAMLEF